jgi:hypothetical protein
MEQITAINGSLFESRAILVQHLSQFTSSACMHCRMYIDHIAPASSTPSAVAFGSSKLLG